MSGHTKGPWVARKSPHGPIDILAADGRDIVTIYGGGVDERPADNARLIAAAPDLHNALWHLMAAYAACNGEDHPAYLAAEAAIAKATEGRS